MKFRIEVFSRRNMFGIKRWYMRIVSAANGEIVASGEAKHLKSNTLHVAERLKQHLRDAQIVVIDGDKL